MLEEVEGEEPQLASSTGSGMEGLMQGGDGTLLGQLLHTAFLISPFALWGTSMVGAEAAREHGCALAVARGQCLQHAYFNAIGGNPGVVRRGCTEPSSRSVDTGQTCLTLYLVPLPLPLRLYITVSDLQVAMKVRD